LKRFSGNGVRSFQGAELVASQESAQDHMRARLFSLFDNMRRQLVVADSCLVRGRA